MAVALIRGEPNASVSALLMLAALLLSLGMAMVMLVGFPLSLDHPKALERVCMMTNALKVVFGIFVAVICRGKWVGMLFLVLLIVSALAGEVQR
eukprot:scaffold69_cov248-Pinguiococcus_pyrenoidosus.AAC.79